MLSSNEISVFETDVLVIGGGIAGASIAAELANERRVVLLEMEARAGVHATGRSAALFSETYGNETIRALSRASRTYFDDENNWRDGQPLLTPRGALFVATACQQAALADRARILGTAAEQLDAATTMQICPVLHSSVVVGSLYEGAARDVDVATLHEGYLARLKAWGGSVRLAHRVERIVPRRDGWRVSADGQTFLAAVLVNAAGAWADDVAAMAGVRRLGLRALRRTALTVDAPAGTSPHDWPAVIDIEEQFYFKPEGGRVLLSPADETEQAPGDAHPEEIDIAIAIDRIERIAKLDVRHVRSRWAGLRTFAPDRSPVVGFDPEAPGFFWLAGQGGYGVQTAPGLARAAAGLIVAGRLPADLIAENVSVGDLAPARFRAPAVAA